MTPPEIPAELITRQELLTVFPWLCYLPDAARGEFEAAVEIYRAAAEIYAGQRQPSPFDLTLYE